MFSVGICYADSVGSVEDWQYYVYLDGTASIRGYSGDDEVVTIPSELDGYEIAMIESFGGNKNVITVNIPDTIKTIYFSAFKDCTSLRIVNIGAGVAKIGGSYNYYPGYNADNDDPSATIAPGSSKSSTRAQNPYQPAFEGCTNLEQFNVSEGNTVFSSEDGVLFNKDKTMLLLCPLGKTGSYTVPSSVTSFDPRGIYNSYKWSPFYDCAKLEELILSDNINDKVEDIKGMDSLRYLYIGKGIIENDDSANSIIQGIKYNLALEQIDVSSEHKTLSSENGVIFNKDKSKLIFFPPAKGGNYTVPSTVKEIMSEAFSRNHALDYITLPDSLETIKAYAFYGCAFKTIDIPQSVTSLYSYVFANSGLISIKFPQKITEIKFGMFSGCESLTSIIIPNTVKTIDMSAFKDCSALENIYYTGTEAEWNEITIKSNNSDLTSANIYFNSDYNNILNEDQTMYYEIKNMSIIAETGETLKTIPENSGFITDVTVCKIMERNDSDYLFVAVYGTDGTLLDLDYVKVNFSVNTDCSFDFCIPFLEKKIGSIKAYVWNDFDSMKPLAEAKTI